MTASELRTRRLSAQYNEAIENLHRPGRIDIRPVRPAQNELLRLQVTVSQPTYLAGRDNRPVAANRTEFIVTAKPDFESEKFIAFFPEGASRVCHPHVWKSNVICIGEQTNYTGLRDIVEKCVRLCVFDPGIAPRNDRPACADFNDWYWQMVDAGKFPTADLKALLGAPTAYRQPRAVT